MLMDRMNVLIFVCLFVLTIFNEGTYLTFQSIFHKALKEVLLPLFFCMTRSMIHPNVSDT